MSGKVKRMMFVGCIMICVLGGVYLAWYYGSQGQKEEIYAKMQKQVSGSKEAYGDIAVPKQIVPIDFEELRKVNEDIYAWITIEDTNIDYPIVQSETDDSYYLNYTIEGVKGYPGSIYTERINKKDFSDFLTVIYGHDMKDGTMFKHLHKYEDLTFFESHDRIQIYTETECKEYQVFAAVVYDDSHLMYAFDYEDKEQRLELIRSLYEVRNMKSHVREDVQVDENSHIIILSTCISGQPNNRYLIGAVEIDE